MGTYQPDEHCAELLHPTRFAHSEPMRRLMAALIEDAWNIVGHTHRERRGSIEATAETLAWVDEPEGSDWPCSFINACAVVGLDPDVLRPLFHARAVRGGAEPAARARGPMRFEIVREGRDGATSPAARRGTVAHAR